MAYGFIGPDIILQFGESLEEEAEFLALLRLIFIPLLLMTTIFAILTGWFMGRKSISGIAAITETAKQISEGAIEKRVKVKPQGDEIDHLAATFNVMVDRINLLVKELRESGDCIAHDLRSPLARMRGGAELCLMKERSLTFPTPGRR